MLLDTEQPRFSPQLINRAHEVLFDRIVVEGLAEVQHPLKNSRSDLKYLSPKIQTQSGVKLPRLGTPDRRKNQQFGTVEQTGVFTRKVSSNS